MQGYVTSKLREFELLLSVPQIEGRSPYNAQKEVLLRQPR